MRHRGEADASLAGGADGDGIRVGAFGSHERLHRVARRPPAEIVGRLELGALLGDDEIARAGRAARDDDGVESRALERGREAAPERRVEEEIGER